MCSRRVVFVRGHCTYIVHLIFVKEGRHILTWERVARDKLFFNIVKSWFILKLSSVKKNIKTTDS